MQNDLILDYRSNVALYPEFQQYLRTHQPPLLAVWGENDPSFIPYIPITVLLVFTKDVYMQIFVFICLFVTITENAFV